jgi:hypothetical protein
MQTIPIEAKKTKKAASRNKGYWREIVTTWQKSNDHPKDFCAKMNIKPGTFNYWRGIFKKESKFIEVEITPPASHLEQFIIECPSGHKVILTSVSEIDQAQAIFKLLGMTL